MPRSVPGTAGSSVSPSLRACSEPIFHTPARCSTRLMIGPLLAERVGAPKTNAAALPSDQLVSTVASSWKHARSSSEPLGADFETVRRALETLAAQGQDPASSAD